MDVKYFVFRAYRYKASGNWEYSLVGCYDTLEAAKQAYHDALGRIIKDSNDKTMCIIFDTNGARIDYDTTDTAAIVPEETEEE